MSQPDWECIAQLGDASPTEYGGLWVLRDKTGVYPEEAERLECPVEDDPGGFGPYIVHRFILERCTYIDGVLSDNRFHPELPAWFAKPESKRAERPQDSTYLRNVCTSMDIDEDELIAAFCSEDPLKRAWAWTAIGDYHGYENLDEYPLHLRRREMKKRYADPRYEVVKP
jgi:hypothetical protein